MAEQRVDIVLGVKGAEKVDAAAARAKKALQSVRADAGAIGFRGERVSADPAERMAESFRAQQRREEDTVFRAQVAREQLRAQRMQRAESLRGALPPTDPRSSRYAPPGMGDGFMGGRGFRGAVAAAGLQFASEQARRMAHAIRDMSEMMRKGEASSGEIAEHFAKTLPFVGGLVEFGRELRAQLDGSAAAVDAINASIARNKMVFDFRAGVASRRAADEAETGNYLTDRENELRMKGLTGLEQKREEAAQRSAGRLIQLQKEKDAAEKKAKDEAQAVINNLAKERGQIQVPDLQSINFSDYSSPERKAALALIAELDAKIANAENQRRAELADIAANFAKKWEADTNNLIRDAELLNDDQTEQDAKDRKSAMRLTGKFWDTIRNAPRMAAKGLAELADEIERGLLDAAARAGQGRISLDALRISNLRAGSTGRTTDLEVRQLETKLAIDRQRLELSRISGDRGLPDELREAARLQISQLGDELAKQQRKNLFDELTKDRQDKAGGQLPNRPGSQSDLFATGVRNQQVPPVVDATKQLTITMKSLPDAMKKKIGEAIKESFPPGGPALLVLPSF